MVLTEMEFDDGRGRYSDHIRVRTPRGWRDQVKQLAHSRNISLGEFVRQAIAEHARAVSTDEGANHAR